MSNRKPVSLTAFGRMIGITEGAVRKAIKSGRIPQDALTTVNGKTKIADVGMAATAWATNSAANRIGLGDIEQPDEELPPEVAMARKHRYERHALWLKVKALEAYQRTQLTDRELVNRDVALATLFEVQNEMLESAPRHRRAQMKQTLDAFRQRAQSKLKAAPAAKRPRAGRGNGS